jgi:hypothetical protein
MIGDHRLIVAVAFATSIVQGAQLAPVPKPPSRTWSDVMYLGGAPGVRGKSLKWENKLTVGPEKISFTGKEKITFELDTASVRRMNYTGSKRTNENAAAAGFAAGGLLGMLLAGSAVKSTDHYLELEYTQTDGTAAAVLFRLHKDNQQQIIDAVHAATGIAK